MKDSILEDLNIRTGMTSINRNILRYFSQIARGRDTIERQIVEGNVEGKDHKEYIICNRQIRSNPVTVYTLLELTH